MSSIPAVFSKMSGISVIKTETKVHYKNDVE